MSKRRRASITPADRLRHWIREYGHRQRLTFISDLKHVLDDNERLKNGERLERRRCINLIAAASASWDGDKDRELVQAAFDVLAKAIDPERDLDGELSARRQLNATIAHFGAIEGIAPPVIRPKPKSVEAACDRINQLAEDQIGQRFPWASEITLAVIVQDAIDTETEQLRKEIEMYQRSCDEHIRIRNEQSAELEKLRDEHG